MKYNNHVHLEDKYENGPNKKFVSLYAITMDNIKRRIKVRIKIGMSKYVTQRLYSYGLPMPDGFYILGLIMIKPEYRNFIRAIEIRLQEICSDIHYHSAARINSKEWLETTPKVIKERFFELYNEHPEMYVEPPSFPMGTIKGADIVTVY